MVIERVKAKMGGQSSLPSGKLFSDRTWWNLEQLTII